MLLFFIVNTSKIKHTKQPGIIQLRCTFVPPGKQSSKQRYFIIPFLTFGQESIFKEVHDVNTGLHQSLIILNWWYLKESKFKILSMCKNGRRLKKKKEKKRTNHWKKQSFLNYGSFAFISYNDRPKQKSRSKYIV